MVKSSVASAYFDTVSAIARKLNVPLHDGPVSVEVELCPPKPKDWEKRVKKDPNAALMVRRIDLDNALKVCLDSLQSVAYNNDNQITSLIVRLGSPVPCGAMVVMIEPDRRWS